MSALPLVVGMILVVAMLTAAVVGRGRDWEGWSRADLRARIRLVATAGLGLVSAAAWLISGILVLFALTLNPRTPADAGIVAVLKIADVLGWLATGAWVLREWSRMRLRVLVPAAIAWTWVLALGVVLAGVSYLPIGY